MRFIARHQYIQCTASNAGLPASTSAEREYYGTVDKLCGRYEMASNAQTLQPRKDRSQRLDIAQCAHRIELSLERVKSACRNRIAHALH